MAKQKQKKILAEPKEHYDKMLLEPNKLYNNIFNVIRRPDVTTNIMLVVAGLRPAYAQKTPLAFSAPFISE